MKWQYPLSKVEPITDTIHGYDVTDNYRWLENDEDPEVKQWVARQNEFSSATIKDNGGFDIFSEELTKQFDDTMFTVPSKLKNGMYLWMERKAGQNQAVLCAKTSLDAETTVVIDPNTIGDKASLDYFRPSTEGRYIAYGISESGSEIATLKIREISSGRDLDDEIQNARYSSISWMPDESSFYYTRGPKPGTVSKEDESYYVKVYKHILGDNPDSDELIFGEDRPKNDMLSLGITMDGRYLNIGASQNWNRNDIYIYDTQTRETSVLVEGVDAKFSIASSSDSYLLNTNYNAEFGRILTAPIGKVPKSIDDWHELIHETNSTLTGFGITTDKIIASYMVDACSKVKIFDYTGIIIEELPLPQFSSLSGLGCSRYSKEFFYGVTGFFTERTVYRYDVESNTYQMYRKHENTPVDAEDYVVKQEWAVSKDGTKIPMFIMHHKNISYDGNNPTMLYGYGCHGASQIPGYMNAFIPWFKRGGVYAIANIRGGGEYGEKWHRDGSMDKKQNTFDDFIAAAEYLIDKQITSPKNLGILGGSNGGLMVGAVMAQRPELFNAVVCRVPVLDMYRYPKFLIASWWVHEFGDPEKPNEFEWLKSWSPYHNIKNDVEYPNILFTTADKDTRVAPLHARKMTALLQSINNTNVVLLRTEIDAGHGPGKSIDKIAESQAYVLAFLASQLGLRV